MELRGLKANRAPQEFPYAVQCLGGSSANLYISQQQHTSLRTAFSCCRQRASCKTKADHGMVVLKVLADGCQVPIYRRFISSTDTVTIAVSICIAFCRRKSIGLKMDLIESSPLITQFSVLSNALHYNMYSVRTVIMIEDRWLCTIGTVSRRENFMIYERETADSRQKACHPEGEALSSDFLELQHDRHYLAIPYDRDGEYWTGKVETVKRHNNIQ